MHDIDWNNLNNAFDFTGKIVLVTGAGQGCGRSIASAFGGRGATVLVNDISHAKAQETVELIQRKNGTAFTAVFDVSDFARVQAVCDEIVARHGKIDVVINNAGNAGADKNLSDQKPFWETEPDEWAHWMGVNLFGVMNTTRVVLPQMIAQKYGRIVVISSDAGRVGASNLVTYASAKAGAAGFIRSIAQAAGRYGITANCIALGGMDTPGARTVYTSDEVIAKSLKNYTIRRLGHPDEAAMMALYLSSDAASWITGQTYPVNGGFSFAL